MNNSIIIEEMVQSCWPINEEVGNDSFSFANSKRYKSRSAVEGPYAMSQLQQQQQLLQQVVHSVNSARSTDSLIVASLAPETAGIQPINGHALKRHALDQHLLRTP